VQGLSPFQTLCAQATRLSRSEKGIAMRVKKGSSGLIFLSGDHVLVTPLEEVAAILPVFLLTPLPGVKPWLKGMATYRGEIFPVTDMSEFITKKISSISKNARILLIRFQGEVGGLLVDRIVGLQRLTEEERGDKKEVGYLPDYDPFIIGAFVSPRVKIPLISCQAIVRHPYFRNIVLRESL